MCVCACVGSFNFSILRIQFRVIYVFPLRFSHSHTENLLTHQFRTYHFYSTSFINALVSSYSYTQALCLSHTSNSLSSVLLNIHTHTYRMGFDLMLFKPLYTYTKAALVIGYQIIQCCYFKLLSASVRACVRVYAYVSA